MFFTSVEGHFVCYGELKDSVGKKSSIPLHTFLLTLEPLLG